MLRLAHYGEYDEALAAAAAGVKSPDGHTRSTAQLCFLLIVESHACIDFDVALPLIRACLNDPFHYAAVNAADVRESALNALGELEWDLPHFSREDFGIAPPIFVRDRDRLKYLAHSRRHYEQALGLASELIKSPETGDRISALLAPSTVARQYRTLDASIAIPMLSDALDDEDWAIRSSAGQAVYGIADDLPALPGLAALHTRLLEEDADRSREDHGIAPPAFTAERDRLSYLAQSGRHRSEMLALATLLSRSAQAEDRCAAMFAFSKLAWRHHTLDCAVAEPILRAGLADADAEVKMCAQLAIDNIARRVPRTPVTERLVQTASSEQDDGG